MRLALIALLAAAPLLAADLEFKEAFADPGRRAAALDKLVPGSRDWFFYRALQQQLAGDTAGYARTIGDWKAAAADPKRLVPTQGLEELDNRRLLLGYETDPEASVKELIRKLDLRFDDLRPEADAAASLPDRLNAELISVAAFRAEAARPRGNQGDDPFAGGNNDHGNAPWLLYGHDPLMAELDALDSFSAEKVTDFHRILRDARHPRVVDLLRRDFSRKNAPRFGEHPVDGLLTHAQLDALAKALPAITASESFDIAWMATLPTRAQASELDPVTLTAHLAHCRAFILSAPPAVDSLKANVLYHHLEMQRQAGNYPLEDFLAYLKLPRSGDPLLLPVKDQQVRVNLQTAFEDATATRAIKDDHELVQALLGHFLATSETTQSFDGLIEPRKLAELHSRAHLLAGDDAAKWSGGLRPEALAALQNEVRVGFAARRPVLLDSEGGAELALELKNTPALLVRAFEIDLPRLAQQGRLGSVSVNMDIDGLVPHLEKRFTFAQPPLQVHAETLPLPELAGPGAWLVECVSGNTTCRTLIRKGQLLPVVEPTAEGAAIRIFDESGEPLGDAAAFVGIQRFPAGPDGVIHLPDQGPSRGAYVQAGKLAADLSVNLRPDLSLSARFHLDREQLLPNTPARLLLTPALLNHGKPLPVDRAGKVRIVLHATLTSGLAVDRVLMQDAKLQPVTEIPFQIPDRTAELTVSVTAEADGGPGERPVELEANGHWVLNSSDGVISPFLSRDSDGYFIELRGKNGEVYPGHPFTIGLEHRDYNEVGIRAEVKTDARGRVALGPLDGINKVGTESADGLMADFDLTATGDAVDGPQMLQAALGDEIRLPLPAGTKTSDRGVSLLQKGIHDRVVADFTAQLQQEGRQVVIHDLPEGAYELTTGDRSTRIQVVAAVERNGVMVREGAAWSRYLPELPVIATAGVEQGALIVKLQRPSVDTRVQIIARRYLQGWAAGEALTPGPFDHPVAQTFSPQPCEYLLDRTLSDEIRYILERRSTLKFPGSMLPRPGLLVNRWTVEASSQENQGGGSGRGGSVAPAPIGRENDGPFPKKKTGDEDGSGSGSAGDPGFLAGTSRVIYQLTPGPDGTVKIPLSDLAGQQVVEVIATSPDGSDRTVVPLPPSEPVLRDLRLTEPLDSTRHYVSRRSALSLAAGAEIQLQGAQDADWRTFSTLGDVYRFLNGASKSQAIAAFAPLAVWNKMTDRDKLAFLADYSCHELHVFLARKDRPFFDKYVRPRLLEKLEPTMIDDLLLGRDLTGYLRPAAWLRLNAVEKALLAQALPEAKAQISRELDLRWQQEAPTPEEQDGLFATTLGGKVQDEPASYSMSSGRTVSAGSSSILAKLKMINIPVIEFDDTSLEEAIDFLRLRAKELDVLELDPSKKGINFVIRRPRGAEGASDPGQLRIKELRLRNVPLAEALRYICDLTHLRYREDDFAVTLMPATELGEDLVSRSFAVSKEMMKTLGWKRSGLPVKQLLVDKGVVFPDGSSAALSGSSLVVRNTPSAIDLIEQLVATGEAETRRGGEASDPFGPADFFAGGSSVKSLGVRGRSEGVLPGLPSLEDDTPSPDPGAEPAPAPEEEKAGTTRSRGLSPWQADRDSTQVWQEANYYQHRGISDESFIGLNAFWLDLARWNGKGRFLSPHFNECTTRLNESLLCLALLDLPYESAPPEVQRDGAGLRLKPASPLLLFYRETLEAGAPEGDAPVLVRQTFHPLDDRFRNESGSQVENLINGSFVAGVPYGMSVVVTNPSGTGQRLELLAQIPAGAIPLENETGLLAASRNLKPYGVVTETLSFYFPIAGTFPVYPLHVSGGEKVLATTSPRTLTVAAKGVPEDAQSWSSIARDGSPDAVLAQLRRLPLDKTDLALIRWRLRDRAFYDRVMTVLKERMSADRRLADYGFYHRDPAVMRTVLESGAGALETKTGRWLDSPLLAVRPRVQFGEEMAEFDTLVNPRAHKFANFNRLSNPAALAQYEKLLDVLDWKGAPDDGDRLTLCVSLLLQDRVEEALKCFDTINPAKLTTRLQYDYLHAVVLFYRNQPQQAREIATAHAGGPQELWAQRFAAVISQADEIARAGQAVEKAETAGEESAPSLTLAMTPQHQLLIESDRLKETELKFYQVDLEMLFSKNPFLSTDSGDLPQILPNEAQQVALDPSGKTLVAIPPRFQDGNVLISASSGTATALRVLDSPALTVTRQTAQRTLQVTDTATRLPLPETYVKVYAMGDDDTPVFHKDGYTDLRGKFDYLTHTGVKPTTIRRLAILTVHPQKGARVEIIDL